MNNDINDSDKCQPFDTAAVKTILKRIISVETNNTSNYMPILRSKLPYHERFNIYKRKRDEIFNISSI